MDKVISFFEDIAGIPQIIIRIDAREGQKFFKAKAGGKKTKRLPAYMGNDGVSGIIEINLKDDQPFQHLGIKCFLIGFLEIYNEQTLSTEFHSLSKQLMPAGTLKNSTKLKFKFNNFEKQYESYYGKSGEVRYQIKASIIQDKYLPNINKEVHFAVLKPQKIQSFPNLAPIRMEVGSENRLHIQLEIFKNYFDIRECIEGKVTFKEVVVPLKTMELWLLRKQCLGSDIINERSTDYLIKYELMDGCPQQGEVVPIRMFLNGVKGITPSFMKVHDRLTVTYSVSLVLFEQSGKKYFKNAPITLYRKLKE